MIDLDAPLTINGVPTLSSHLLHTCPVWFVFIRQRFASLACQSVPQAWGRLERPSQQPWLALRRGRLLHMERKRHDMGPFHGPEPWAFARNGYSLPFFVTSDPVFPCCWKMRSVFHILPKNEIRFSILTENEIRFSHSGGAGCQKLHKQGVSVPLFVAIGSVFRIFTKNEIRFSIPTKNGSVFRFA